MRYSEAATRFVLEATEYEGFVIRRKGNSQYVLNSIDFEIDYRGDTSIKGYLSKSSGSFRIPHPLPEKKETHDLVHSFVESPFADLVYCGMVDLGEGGKATVNVDKESQMTEGTFNALTCNRRYFSQNTSGFVAVKCNMEGNLMHIYAHTPDCRDKVYWQVVAERCDEHMISTNWSDDKGRVIVEPLRKVRKEEDEKEDDEE